MKLKDKRILLIGASGGIGQSIASALDKRQARLLLVGRDEIKLRNLINSLNGDHQFVSADLNTQEGRSSVIDASKQQELDIFISAIGVMDFRFCQQQESQRIEQMLSTNLLAPILLCQQLIPLLLKRPQAVIVNIGSIFGSIGHPGFTAYCASKFGLRGFSEALQRELADTSIKVSYLAPRATRTELNSSAVNALNATLGNTTDAPQRVAGELLNLLSGKRRQRYIGWPERLFVRLNNMFPGIVHKALVNKLDIIRHHAAQQI